MNSMMLAGTLNADLSRQEDEELTRLRQLRSEMEVEEHLLLDMNTSTRFASMRVARTAPAPITSPTRSVDGHVPSTDDAESFEVTIRKKILLDRLITSSLKRQRITLAFAKELSAMPVDEGLQRIQEHYSGGLFHLDPDNEDDEDFAEAQREALKIIGLRKALGDSQATSDSQPTAAAVAVAPVVVNRSPAIGSTAKQGANSRRARQRRVELNAAEPANESRHSSLSSSGRDRRYSTISDGFGSMQPYEGMSHAARAIKRASMASSALGGRPLSGDGGAAGDEGTALSLTTSHGTAGGSLHQNNASAGRAATTRLFFTQVVEDHSTTQPAAEQRGSKTGSKPSHRRGRKTSPHNSSAAPGDAAMRRMVMEGIKDSLVSHFTSLASVKGITVFDEDTALGTLDEKGIGMKGFIDFNGRGLGPDVQWPTTLQVGGWTFQVSHSGSDAVPALAADAGVPLNPAAPRPTNDPPHQDAGSSPGSGGGMVESRPQSVTANSDLASSLLRQVASGLSPPPERLTVSPRSGVGSPWGNESSSAVAVAPTSARVDAAAAKGAARQRNGGGGAGKAGAKKSVAPPSTAPVGSVRPRLGLMNSVVKRSEPTTTTAHSGAADSASLKSLGEASAPSAPRPLPLTSAADWAKLPSIPRSFLAPPAMAGFLPHSELRCSTAAAAAVTARRPNTRGTATDGDFGWTASSTPRGLTSRGSNNTTASAAAATTQGPFVVERFYTLLPRECADALMERRQASAEWAIQSAAHATVTIGREERSFVPQRPGGYTAAAASSQRPTSEQTPLVLQQTAWQSRSTASMGAAPAVPTDLLLDGLVKQTPLSPRGRRPPTNDRPHRL